MIDLDGKASVSFGFSVKMSGQFQSAELSSHVEIPIKPEFLLEHSEVARQAAYQMVSDEIAGRTENLPKVLRELKDMSNGR